MGINKTPSPTRWMTTSLPLKRYSLGSRTAWLRPVCRVPGGVDPPKRNRAVLKHFRESCLYLVLLGDLHVGTGRVFLQVPNC